VSGFFTRRSVLGAGIAAAASMALPRGALAAGKATAAATKLNDLLLLVSGLGGNLVALRGDEGLLLVDSGAPGATDALVAELAKFARGAKVHTVINTHWHADETGGNDVFGAVGAKLIAHAPTRAQALNRMRHALDEFIIGGIRTNIDLHKRLLDLPEMRDGTHTTRTVGFVLSISTSCPMAPRASPFMADDPFSQR